MVCRRFWSRAKGTSATTERKRMEDSLKHALDSYFNSTPERDAKLRAEALAFHEAAAVIVDRVKAGELTEQEAAIPLAELMKRPLRYAQNYLMHALHQDELDRLERE